MRVHKAASHTMSEGAASAAHVVTPPMGWSSLSSLLSSFLNDQPEFRELIHAVDKAHQFYSDATHDVGRLEHCLDTIKVALEASERETTAVQVAAADSQTRIVIEDASLSYRLVCRLPLLIVLSSYC